MLKVFVAIALAIGFLMAAPSRAAVLLFKIRVAGVDPATGVTFGGAVAYRLAGFVRPSQYLEDYYYDFRYQSGAILIGPEAVPGTTAGRLVDFGWFWAHGESPTAAFSLANEGLRYRSSAGTGFVPGRNLTIFEARLATAVPEPSSWAILVTGFGLVGGCVRRRRAGPAIAA